MTKSEVLEVWTRQSKMVLSLFDLVDEDIRKVKPSDQGMPLDLQFTHIILVRKWWLSTVSSTLSNTIPWIASFDDSETTVDLSEIRKELVSSSAAILSALSDDDLLENKFGPYDSPTLFFGHMLWHDGYHVGQIMLALMKAGREPSDQWSETNIWELWRGPE